ncbi:MAG: aldehyde dehydrogenase family protein [Hyphomicrobiales bacterium]
MDHNRHFYIDGTWVEPVVAKTQGVVDPSTEDVFTEIPMGSAADVDKAVAAARRAFASFSQTTPAQRRDLLRGILEAFTKRWDDMAAAISREMGAPPALSRDEQVWCGEAHLKKIIAVMEDYEFERRMGPQMILREPIGVVGLITPWNWPMNQITSKVGPALAAGCTMVLKPSEIAPLNAIIFAEILHEAGVPPGVFNLVNGDGPSVGHPLASHPDVDMVSFTGSTRAGIAVAKAAADTVKRVHQELGGKSANILFDDAGFAKAVHKGAKACFANSGQSCNAPTRMYVPRARMDEAAQIAAAAANGIKVGSAHDAASSMGPVVSEMQFNKIQELIAAGIREGATLAAGGTGRPAGLNRGYFVRPTVFSNVAQDMRIAREEIFGPVLSILPFDTEEQVIALANDSVFGLAAYVQSQDMERARRVARQLRAGQVRINYPAWDAGLPFGGYKQSGNGREYGAFGLDDFTEIKGIGGYWPE